MMKKMIMVSSLALYSVGAFGAQPQLQKLGFNKIVALQENVPCWVRKNKIILIVASVFSIAFFMHRRKSNDQRIEIQKRFDEGFAQQEINSVFKLQHNDGAISIDLQALRKRKGRQLLIADLIKEVPGIKTNIDGYYLMLHSADGLCSLQMHVKDSLMENGLGGDHRIAPDDRVVLCTIADAMKSLGVSKGDAMAGVDVTAGANNE